MVSDSRNLRPFFFLFAGMLVWWFAPSAFRRVVHKAVFEFEAPAVLLSSRIEDLAHYWELRSRGNDELIRAGRDTARLLSMQQFEISQTAALRSEISRLEKMLTLPSRPEFRFVPARVAQRRLGMWWQQIIVRRGSADGVLQGCPVVNADGVVGRVREVFSTSCVVELVSSPSFRISAKIAGADDVAITYRGAGAMPFSSARGVASDIPLTVFSNEEQSSNSAGTPLASAREIVTSGLGGIFPAGMKIGKLVPSTKSISGGGLFCEAEVELPARLSSIEEVAILVPVDAKIFSTEKTSDQTSP